MSTHATATITANIGQKHDTQKFEGGRRLASMSVCVNRRYMQGGQKVEAADWYKIQTNNPALIDLIEGCAVGERLSITGALSLKEFTRKDKTKGMSVEIWADRIYYVDGKRDDSKSEGEQKAPATHDMDDHIPF